MNSSDNIIGKINANAQVIVDNIPVESPSVYVYLKEQFDQSNVKDNYVFQFLYRSFYRLDNAGLTPEFKTEYFRIMENNRNAATFDVRSILDELYYLPNRKGQNTIQFSFVTKMLNTINDNYPIYDNEVKKVVGFKSPSNTRRMEDRIDEYLNQITYINTVYSTILSRSNDFSALDLFDHRFQNVQMSQIKKLDFIMWSAGKIS